MLSMNSYCVCHSEVFRPAAGEFKGEGSVWVMMRRRKSPTNDAVFHIAAGRDRAGLDVQHISAFKGRGVFAVTGLARGEFVLEYRGDLISAEESRRRRRVYPGAMKGFMFDFLWHGKFWTIDAARDDGSLGRLVNDDHINPNCKMKRLIVEGRPHLCLFALRDITPGEELTYDYGDADCPWRSEVTKSGMEADNNHLESEGASGDDQHRTKPSQHKSAFGVQMTKNGMEAGSKRLESDGASGDDHHRTQHLQHESTFPNQVITTVMQEDGRHLKFDLTCGNAQQQRSAFLVQLDDACSISSVESSDDEYVPGSSDSSSDESACSRMISVSKRKAKTTMKRCRSHSPSSGQSSAAAANVSEVVPDQSSSEAVPDQSSSEAVPDQSSSEAVPDQSSSEAVPDQSSSEAVPDQSSSVLVRGISKPTSKPRAYDKKQYCLFCSKSLSKMARHLEQVHSNESEVVKALSFSKGSKERKRLLDHLRNRGNFAHNAEVLQCGKGDLVPCKKPRKDCESYCFVHCCNCQGLFAKKFLWRHMKQCKLRKNDSQPKPGKNRVLSQSAYMGPAPHGTSAGLWKLLSTMSHGEVALAIKTDLYIRRLGEYFYNRIGSDTGKHEYVRQKMREVGRLLITAREVTPLCKMEDFIDPANFMHVITAIRKACGYDEEKCTYQRPSLALKLGHSLQKIASLVSFQAMMDKDTERAEKARNFSDMYAARWGEFISSHALRTQREVKWNAPLVLPFTEDVKRLHLYLDQKQEEFFQKLSEDASSKNWTLLAKVTLAQTILFNRRREGEVSKMPLTSFASRSTDDLHEDVALALSELEKKLCHHFSRIEIRGKRGRKVPVLLTPTMQRNMELLKEKREECVVPSENIYMFARPAALSHLRGSDCLREFATECGAKNPKALSSTKLRKHIATLSNVLNLSNTELDQLADFLGHDVRVHRDYYRLPEGTLQLAKISKILMALETGRLGEFSGKNLDEIHIDPNEAVLVQSSDLSRDLSNTEDESDEDPGAEPDLEPSTQQAQETLAEQAIEPTSTTTVPKGVKMVKRKKWETSEVKAVEKHLNRFIKTCTVPGKKDCEACIKAEPLAFKDRDWLSVKFFVKNRITALKRKM
ncbi:hypothetical protein MHYP_G00252140 [Metynnis hypsauchen]